MKRTVLAILVSASLAVAAGDGKAIYDKACKSCHGASGAPNPAIAKMMKVEMKDLSSAEVQKLSDDDMKKIITEGQGKMKPVKAVTDVAAVIAYVRSLKK
jgi:mono/diheme cytochrome c family protein